MTWLCPLSSTLRVKARWRPEESREGAEERGPFWTVTPTTDGQGLTEAYGQPGQVPSGAHKALGAASGIPIPSHTQNADQTQGLGPASGY